MKKLYLIATLLFFVTPSVLAQNPNNHWQLGVSDVNFTTNPSIVATVSNNSQYGIASISDDNGNLLFYTDGKTVWNKNHSVMTNGSNIGYSGVINTIIVPNLANPNQFYVFRSEEYLKLCLCANSTYYLYSIVEFNSLNPLGIVLSINSSPLASTPENQYSKTLSGSSGIVENAHTFGALTSTKNNNDTAFWVIVQNQNKLLSYKIDFSGLNTTPVESTFTNTQIYNPGTNNTHGNIEGLEGAMFRIAPNNSFLIGLEYSKVANQYDSDGNFLFFNNFFYKTNFNSTTGVFSDYESFGGGVKIYNFEISNQSTNLFYIRTKLSSDAPPYISNIVDGEICVKDLTNSSNPIRILNEFGTTTPSSKFSYLQRDKYDNLLVSSTYTSSNRNLYLHKIDNQNSYSGSSVVLNSISLNSNSISVLPQLIPLVTPPCVDNLVITLNVTSGADNKQASNTIIASNAFDSGAAGIYHAGSSVTLSPGFNAKPGSTFRAYIAGCTNTFVQKKKSSKEEMATSNEEFINSKDQESYLKFYPNPTTGIFKIALNIKSEGSVVITDMFGKTVYTREFKDEDELEVDIQNQASGIYIVKINTVGQDFIQKIIKQ